MYQVPTTVLTYTLWIFQNDTVLSLLHTTATNTLA